MDAATCTPRHSIEIRPLANVAYLRIVQHQLKKRVRVPFDVIRVPCKQLLMRKKVCLELFPHKMVALLLLEVHCTPSESSQYPALAAERRCAG